VIEEKRLGAFDNKALRKTSVFGGKQGKVGEKKGGETCTKRSSTISSPR